MYIEGKLQTDSWEDRDTGQKKYRTKVRADNVQMLGTRQGGEQRSRPPAEPPQGQEDFDDDIPF